MFALYEHMQGARQERVQKLTSIRYTAEVTFLAHSAAPVLQRPDQHWYQAQSPQPCMHNAKARTTLQEGGCLQLQPNVHP